MGIDGRASLNGWILARNGQCESGEETESCGSAMSAKNIYYSDKYDDELYEYRHVMLPKDIAKRVPKTHLMSESEWRNLGVQQSQGWVHYMIHEPGKTTYLAVPKAPANQKPLAAPPCVHYCLLHLPGCAVPLVPLRLSHSYHHAPRHRPLLPGKVTQTPARPPLMPM
ncbi:hypothetical protein XELAEV_18042993mg [Xenopus laevis]|uniref:Cyclin-dependent kinases regulatory subunit n=1 Tax=Xenopus laevis TaxID=8355 RepID=A0A974C509_XENLA|nr:hypothetical protein XELAEV_18042993mg [Xenopus laevis]